MHIVVCMAKKIVQLVEFVDDLDGSPVDEADVQTVKFSYKGTDYKIDLKPANAKKLDDALNKYIAAAEKVSHSRGRAAATSRPGTGSGRSKEDLAAIREWAGKNGHEVSPRGRVPASVLEAFDAAH